MNDLEFRKELLRPMYRNVSHNIPYDVIKESVLESMAQLKSINEDGMLPLILALIKDIELIEEIMVKEIGEEKTKEIFALFYQSKEDHHKPRKSRRWGKE